MSKQPEFKNKYVTVWDSNWGLSLTVEKRFKDKKTNDWRSTNRFFLNELDDLIKSLQEAKLALPEPENQKIVNHAENINFNDDEIPF